ncbi:response regulator [Catenovulum agarivorans DS-2]|uniref:Response regulator n=1 Tax=Catenovulum agarivorans DS-2 TaxID=1328313 RepID=W7QIQ3_9ALTE|nr:response regulator transcription factor [Catenovulum agarivorans]EWH08807.1 response regulator [Catenovulum agarivorans DS-2]
MKLLVVEDNEHIRKSIVRAFKANKYVVDDTGDGEDGLWHALEYNYDVIVLDIMLPKLDGKQILQKIRQAGKDTPVLFLTALDQLDDKIEGFKIGADDYLVKSFAIEELLARVEALSRRRYQAISSVIKVADLELDRSARTVSRNGQLLSMTPQSFSLLELFMLRKGQVISRSEIEQCIYDEHVNPMSNVVESAIYALRKALQVDKSQPQLIQTKRGMGYYLQDPGCE